jgi:hypothetical protein
VPRSLRALLINGALIASLFIAIALGNSLGGAWNYLFPVWILTLFVIAMVVLRRRPSLRRPVSVRSRLLLIATAVVAGFLLEGLPLALIGGIGAGLAVLLVLGIERFS